MCETETYRMIPWQTALQIMPVDILKCGNRANMFKVLTSITDFHSKNGLGTIKSLD